MTWELARTAPEARFVGRDEADLSDPETCAELLRASGASVVINAAYTAVDKAESEEGLARLDCSTTEAVFGLARPECRAGLGDVLKVLGAMT